MGSSAVAIVLNRAERHVLDQLRRAGADSPRTAVALDALRPLPQVRLERLVDAGVVHEPEPGRYYLDERAYRALRNSRRATVIAVLAIAAALAFWFGIFASRR